MDYPINDCLYGTQHKSELLRQALKEMDWRQNGDLNILDGRTTFTRVLRTSRPSTAAFPATVYPGRPAEVAGGIRQGNWIWESSWSPPKRSEKEQTGIHKRPCDQEVTFSPPSAFLSRLFCLTWGDRANLSGK